MITDLLTQLKMKGALLALPNLEEFKDKDQLLIDLYFNQKKTQVEALNIYNAGRIKDDQIKIGEARQIWKEYKSSIRDMIF